MPTMATAERIQTGLSIFSIILLIGVVVSLGAPLIVRVLFGAEYAPTAPVLAVLVWYIPVFYSYQVVNDLLVTDRLASGA